MKKIIHSLFLVSSLLLFSAQNLKATHSVGANISFVHDTLNTYIITVKFYRNCGDAIITSPAPAPAFFVVNYNSASCGLSGSEDVYQIANTGQEIPTGQFPPCYQTSCNGGTGYGVQEYIYKGNITLPSACSDWVISTSTCCRNQIITTVTSPGNLYMYVEALLDNLNYPNNSSPVFSTYPVSRFCINHTFLYDQGATDPDGDSLVYSLVDAYTLTLGVPAPISYVTTPILYSGTYPISSNPPVTIDSTTGIITLTPNLIQVGVIAILVKEYRNGVLIGSVRRDMQVNVEATCNFPPILHLATFNSIVANCGDSILILHLSSPIKCSSIASDGSDFRMRSPGGLPIPIIREIPIHCTSGLTDSIEIHLYPPDLTENGTYAIWSKVGNDGNTLLNDCDYAMREYDTAFFSFNNCYHGIVDLTNVTVNNVNSNMEVYWTAPAGMPISQFQAFEVLRSDDQGSSFHTVGQIYVPTANSFIDTDTAIHVPLKPYRYVVSLHLNGFVSPRSDSIQSIYLSCNEDTASVSLNWTPYWGWSNPVYQLMESNDNGASFYAVSGYSTTGTSMVYTKAAQIGNFLLRIHTSSGGSPNLLSRSNWCSYSVTTVPEHVAQVDTIPNVFTPNSDGKNSVWEIKHLADHKYSLTVFNRWGKKVHESKDLATGWDGKDISGKELADGVYYYVIQVENNTPSVFKGTVTIFRGK